MVVDTPVETISGEADPAVFGGVIGRLEVNGRDVKDSVRRNDDRRLD